jgi:hypothetical protein
MISKKKIIFIGAFILLTGSLFAVSKPVYAANGGMWGGNFFSGFIDFISQKFGLNKTQVQSALQDYQAQQKATITPRPTMSPADRQAAEKKRYDVLVSQGKITTEQENLIINELEALRTKYNLGSQNNETSEQRKTDMQNMQNELKTWAESQNIDPNLLMPGFGMGGRGFGMGRGGDKSGLKGNWGSKPTGAQ